MPASFNELLNHILNSNPNIGRDKLLLMVEQKKTESHGLLSDEGAIRLVAQQLSVASLPSAGMSDQRIVSVHAGLNNSTITGQVVSVGENREFTRTDGSQGKVLRMRVGDGSGEITCVFWDNLADMVAREGLTPGSQVRLLHGYTKQAMGGEVEFHLGSRASLQILRRSSEQITIGTPDTSVNFRASDILRIRLLRLQKSQSDKGPTWALCSDGSALLTVKFWDNQAQEILSFGEGSIVKIHNHWVTERNGMVYLNVGSKSTVERAAEGEVGGVPFSSIGAIKPGPVLWSISGKIIERGEPREIETREGRRTRVSNINLEDSSSRIRVSFWDAHAEKTESLRIGDSIRLVGIKVRENMNGEKEASTVFLTQLEKQ
jgi:replication factor A1